MERGVVGGLSGAAGADVLVGAPASAASAALWDRARRFVNTQSRYPEGEVPRLLFLRGEQGGWWDSSDIETLFQDAAGTVPVRQLGQPVGRILDKSGNGNHLVQAIDAARPTWQARSNLLLATTTLATQTITTIATPYTLSFTGTGTVTLSGTSTDGPLVGTGVGQRVSLTFTPTAGALTLTVSGTVTDAQLELGSTATQYQRVTTATDYEDIGLPRYLQFDGFDDFLRTAVGADMRFSATDEVTFCAGARAGGTGSVRTLVDHRDRNVDGSFRVGLPSTVGSLISVGSRGSILRSVGYSADLTTQRVYTGLAKIGAPTLTLRVNGAVEATTTETQGTGTYLDGNLTVGKRVLFSTEFFNGNWHQLVIRNVLTNDPALSALERFVGQRTGIVL
jgi:hypothetical protein